MEKVKENYVYFWKIFQDNHPHLIVLLKMKNSYHSFPGLDKRLEKETGKAWLNQEEFDQWLENGLPLAFFDSELKQKENPDLENI